MLGPQIVPFYAVGLFFGLYEVRLPRVPAWLTLLMLSASSYLVVFAAELV